MFLTTDAVGSPGSGWPGDSVHLELASEEKSRKMLKLRQAFETHIRGENFRTGFGILHGRFSPFYMGFASVTVLGFLDCLKAGVNQINRVIWPRA